MSAAQAFPPIEIVVVPRAVAEQYYGRPWTDVHAAAQAGTDGLRVSDDKTDYRPSSTVAHLRKHDGRAFLFRQGWTSEKPFIYYR